MMNSVTPPPTDCPSADVLHRFMEDRLPEAETASIEKHLEGCGDCEKAVELLEREGIGALERQETSMQSSTSMSHGSLIELLADPVKIEALPLPEFSVPKQIDKYEILEVLGSGGMGTVLRARHLHLKRDVAIKLIKGARRFDPWAVTRFLQEIEAIGKVDHANIVRAIDAGVDDNLDTGGQPYLVMELLQGRDVETLVKRRGPLSVTDSCKLIRQAATGLDQIHRAGLVHRDVKPSNLFVTKSGIVKLLDLGLARLYEDEPMVLADTSTDDGSEIETQNGTTAIGLTGKLTVLGSPLFIAPEQIEQSHRVDHRADIYSLGCTFYYLLAGRPPFEGTRSEVLAAHLEGRFPSITNIRNDIPPLLADLIRHMAARNPAERIGSAKEIVDVLNTLKEKSKPTPPVPPVIVMKKKHPVKSYLVGACVSIVVLVALSFFFLMPSSTEQATLPVSVQQDLALTAFQPEPDEAIQPVEKEPETVEPLPVVETTKNIVENSPVENITPPPPVAVMVAEKKEEDVHIADVPAKKTKQPEVSSSPPPKQEEVKPVAVKPIDAMDDPLNTPKNPLFWYKPMSGKVAFDFSKNGKCCAIGEGVFMFETRWSTRRKDTVLVYNDPPSIDGVALATAVADPRRITEASRLDFSQRTHEVKVGSLVVLRNRHGKYAVLRVTKIVDSYRTEAPNDWLEFDYYILPDGDDFGKMRPAGTKGSS